MKLALPLAVLALVPLVVPQDAPLKPKEVDALVAEYFALDGKSEEGVRAQDELLAKLGTVPPLAAKDVKKWRKKLEKLFAKGPKLEKKGTNFLWEDEERGKYIVGGKSKKPKGLFVGFHGGGAGSGAAESSHGGWSGPASGMDCVGIFPEVLKKTGTGWTSPGTEEFVLELVERAMRTWKIDPDRVFFGGHSMGGYGTWTLGGHHADRVAGLTPSAGAPTPILEGGEAVDIVEGIAPNLRNTRVVIYQSDDDPRVPPGANRAAAKRLETSKETWGGYDFEYWEVSGRGHDPPPGGYGALLEKVEDHRRTTYPERVVWQPRLKWKRRFYWLWWEEPARNAIVVADLDREANAVTITSSRGTEGLWVLLNAEVLDLSKEVVVTAGGAEVWRGVPEPTLASLVLSMRYGDPRMVYEARVPAWKR